MFKTTLTAAALVAATALSAIPAAANQISIGFSAGNQEERDLIAGGLALYQIANGADPAEVLGNAMGGNLGVIHQEGNGHNGSLVQGGNGNAGGVFQFGENTNGHLVQGGGQGRSGLHLRLVMPVPIKKARARHAAGPFSVSPVWALAAEDVFQVVERVALGVIQPAGCASHVTDDLKGGIKGCVTAELAQLTAKPGHRGQRAMTGIHEEGPEHQHLFGLIL